MSSKLMTIGQVAKLTNVSIRTLRYYHTINLLLPTNYTEGGHRLYSSDDIRRLQQIQSLTFVGFSLKNTAELLETTNIEKQDPNPSV